MLLPVLALVVQVIRTEVSVLQPYEVRSWSGEWTAHVDPTSRFGIGPSNVRVEHAGQLAWQAELPFTLAEAQLADTGHLGGYGFTDGLPWIAARGEFVVATVDPTGKVLLDKREPMVDGQYVHRSPDPNPKGTFLGDQGRELVVRIANRDQNEGREAWRRFELATGESRPSLDPRSKLGRVIGRDAVKDVRGIPGAPLLLVEWDGDLTEKDGKQALGSCFALLEDGGEVVWSLYRPEEVVRETSDESYRELRHLRASPGILALPAERRFELRDVAARQRVTYEATAGANEKPWEVREVARIPWELEPEYPKLPDAGALEWKDVVTVPLEVEYVPWSELEWIRALAPSADGTTRFVLLHGFGHAELLTLDAKGEVTTRVVPVATPERIRGDHWLWLGDGTWLVVAEGNEDRSTKAWFVEHRTGAVSELLDFPDWRGLALARRPDGGFVVLNSEVAGQRAGIFDATGELESEPWNLSQHEVSAVAVAVGKDSSVYMLDDSRKEVACFDLEGNLKRRCLLPTTRAAPKEELNYYSRILVEPAGTLLVCSYEPGHKSEWLRLDAEGKLLGRFSLHRADGSTDVDHFLCVAQDEAGVLWGAVHAEIFTIDEAGVTTTRFGARQGAPRLEDPDVPIFDAFRRIVICDARSRAVLVFRSDGKLEPVLQAPGNALGNANTFNLHVVAGPQARCLVQFDDHKDKWLEFDTEGKFVRERELGGELALWLPGGDFWVAKRGRHDECQLRRVAMDGSPLVRIERQPDRRFFDQIDAIGPGPAEGVAVLVGQYRERWILLYDQHGSPKHTLLVPVDDQDEDLDVVCWAGEWAIAASHTSSATVVHVATGKCFRVTAPSDNDVFGWTLSPDGKEVWCAGVNPPALMKLALPKL